MDGFRTAIIPRGPSLVGKPNQSPLGFSKHVFSSLYYIHTCMIYRKYRKSRTFFDRGSRQRWFLSRRPGRCVVHRVFGNSSGQGHTYKTMYGPPTRRRGHESGQGRLWFSRESAALPSNSRPFICQPPSTIDSQDAILAHLPAQTPSVIARPAPGLECGPSVDGPHSKASTQTCS